MKRKGHLAVFENISEGNSTKNQQDDDSNDLLEDEEASETKVRKKRVKLRDEPKTLICKHDGCSEEIKDYNKFNEHLIGHIKEQKYGTAPPPCKFGECDFRPHNHLHAIQHISYHGYHEKLMKLGEIAVQTDSLPDCNLEYSFHCPMNAESYACEWEYCNVKTETYFDFLIHVKMHVNGNPRKDKGKNIKCGWKGCTKTFSVVYYLGNHSAVHTKEKYIACPKCGTTFCSLARFCDHRRKQLPIEKRNYKCSQCFKLFAAENLLRDHVRSHINQYKCSMCDMTCPNPSNLAIHMRYRHLNYRPFKCNLCNHSSITRQNLEQHLITHCVEKLLTCDECDYQCRSMYGLDKHIQREHGQNYGQTFECHICKKQFNRGAYLTKHLMKTHGVQWPSGHSRFRYKEDPDGICRLQTIRYETVDVIKAILENKTDPPTNSTKKLRCVLIEKKTPDGDISFEGDMEEVLHDFTEDCKPIIESDSSNVLLTIADLDDQGNVVSEVVESQEIIREEKFDVEEVKLIELS